MLAMQYTITLPTDFNPSLIRERVEKRSALFDTLEGLKHKSFLYNEEDKLYAPFYVWQDDTAAKAFLLHDLFKGVIDSFARPRVRNWNVILADKGGCSGAPTYAVREADLIASEDSLDTLVEKEQARHVELIQNPYLYYHVVALDSDRWELVRFSLWKNEREAKKSSADCVQPYHVLHVCD